VSGKDLVNGVCQAGATWDRATAAERERCAKIAETEAAEYQRQIDAHNKELLRLYPAPLLVDPYFQEAGVYLHAKESASRNLAGLIRLDPAAYAAALERTPVSPCQHSESKT